MKRIKFLILAVLLPMSLLGKSISGFTEITFSCCYSKQQYCHKRHHRMPLAPIKGVLAGHTLNVTGGNGEYFELSNENGILYSGYLSADGEVEIPSDFVGIIKMTVQKGDYEYVAMIELD
jgi:hypothetical protein